MVQVGGARGPVAGAEVRELRADMPGLGGRLVLAPTRGETGTAAGRAAEAGHDVALLDTARGWEAGVNAERPVCR